MSDSTPSEEKAASSSLGELLGEVTRDLSQLMRQELQLAKAEAKESASRAGKAAGLLSGAGYAGLMTIFFLSLALWWALGTLVGGGWSGVIVSALWAVSALIMFGVGRAQVAEIRGTPETVDTLKEIPDALKRNEENR
jgi:hypothetical protein